MEEINQKLQKIWDNTYKDYTSTSYVECIERAKLGNSPNSKTKNFIIKAKSEGFTEEEIEAFLKS